MTRSEYSKRRTIRILRWVGYGLLVLALFDFIDIFVPLRLQNPAWEFQTLGALVERVPVPLLGLALVFYGEADFREDEDWEIVLLKCLSWLCLLFGLLYLLLIPLGVSNTLRLNFQNEIQINAQLDQRVSQIQQLQELLNNGTDKDIEELLTRLSRQSRTPNITTPQQLEETKSQLSSFLTQAQERLKTGAGATRTEQRLRLLKRSVKWNLGALVSGVLFFGLWRSTRWARQF